MAMTTTGPVDPLVALEGLFARLGGRAYGEAVTQLEHAVQCGAAAEAEGASPALVVAAVLHDVGHLLHEDAGGSLARELDDRHEALGAAWLRQWFAPEVTVPVALHVEAKRYLCAVDAGYAAALSPVSRTTLRLQGGAMTEAEVVAFVARPFAGDAVRLRRWDDVGKVPGASMRPLASYLAMAAALVVR